MYEDIFQSIRQAAEKRNLRERTIQLYCSNVSYFLRCTNKPVTDLTLEDADAFLTMKRLEGRSPETHNHYRSSIKFLYKRVLKIAWDDEEVPAMKRERNLPTCVCLRLSICTMMTFLFIIIPAVTGAVPYVRNPQKKSGLMHAGKISFSQSGLFPVFSVASILQS